MKIRTGFVSNSSSASFVVTIKTDLSDDKIENLIRKSNEFLDEWWEGGEAEFVDYENIVKGKPFPKKMGFKEPARDKVYHRKSQDIIELKLYTTMFNDWKDVPAWKFVRALSENKVEDVKLIEIRQTEYEYSDCNDVVEFDSKCWEYEYKEEKCLIAQNKVDMEYLDYLAFIGYQLTDSEIIQVVKNQLNQ